MTSDDVTLSVVIPTISRPTLARTLASLKDQDWREGDEVLLVGDGPQPQARELWGQFGLPGFYVELPRGGHWGHVVRNAVLDEGLASGSHLAALDDDDCFAPGAVGVMRGAVGLEPGRPHLFRMDWRTIGGKVLWEERVLRVGNVGTPMFVAPNDPGRLGRYGMTYEGDFAFIRGTCDRYEGGPVWRPEVTILCRPHLRT